jgi:Kef-type K+ transport system membrane component KefB
MAHSGIKEKLRAREKAALAFCRAGKSCILFRLTGGRMEISLAVALCLILAAALSAELKISSAVLEISFGLLLSLFIPDMGHVPWLSYLAKLGMLALMFVAGFELDVGQLRRRWKSSGTVGVFSLCLPLAGVYYLARYGLSLDHKSAALIGIGLSTTSLALVYHALREKKLLDSGEGQAILGAASVVDVLSMVCLALLLGEASWGTALFILFFIFSLFSLPKFGAWIFERYSDSMAEPELRFLMVILVAMGFMAESVGSIHPAIISFIVGIVMAKLIEENAAVKEKMLSLVFSFFAPVFFLHAGTRIHLGDLTFHYVLVGIALFLIATSLKYIGTYLPALLCRMEQRRFMGILFNYRLSFGIITANVGLETKIITPQFYAVILLVVVASAALPAFLLRERGAGGRFPGGGFRFGFRPALKAEQHGGGPDGPALQDQGEDNDGESGIKIKGGAVDPDERGHEGEIDRHRAAQPDP